MLRNMEATLEHAPCLDQDWISDWHVNLSFCSHAYQATGTLHFSLERFPELLTHEPKKHWEGAESFWFDPYDRIRIKILKKIIFKMEHPIIGWFINLFKK
jgi:hypothetical protein